MKTKRRTILASFIGVLAATMTSVRATIRPCGPIIQTSRTDPFDAVRTVFEEFPSVQGYQDEVVFDAPYLVSVPGSSCVRCKQINRNQRQNTWLIFICAESGKDSHSCLRSFVLRVFSVRSEKLHDLLRVKDSTLPRYDAEQILRDECSIPILGNGKNLIHVRSVGGSRNFSTTIQTGALFFEEENSGAVVLSRFLQKITS